MRDEGKFLHGRKRPGASNGAKGTPCFGWEGSPPSHPQSPGGGGNLPSFVLSENIKCLLPWAVHTRKRKWDQGEIVGWTILRGTPVPPAARQSRS